MSDKILKWLDIIVLAEMAIVLAEIAIWIALHIESML